MRKQVISLYNGDPMTWIIERVCGGLWGIDVDDDQSRTIGLDGLRQWMALSGRGGGLTAPQRLDVTRIRWFKFVFIFTRDRLFFMDLV